MNFKGDEIEDTEFDELDRAEVERLVEYEKHLEKAKERYGKEQIKRRREALFDEVFFEDDKADEEIDECGELEDEGYDFVYEEEESGAYGGYAASTIEADLRGEDIYNDDVDGGEESVPKADNPESYAGLFSTLSKSIEIYLSGEILLKRTVAKYYIQMLIIAGLSIFSIIVLFWSLYIDIQHDDLRSEVQLLHERSLEMLRRKTNVSSYSAVEEELEKRNIRLERASKSPRVM